MSIYCSIFDLGYDHKSRCARIERTGRNEFRVHEKRPCTCGSSPIVYKGSHVLPGKKDVCGGFLGLAAIPGHISSKGRKAQSEDFLPWHPWLRVSTERDDFVLTRKQVERLRDALNDWLKKASA